MSLLLIAVPVSVLLAIVAVGSFVWSIRSGKVEDLDRSGMRRLLSARNGTDTQAEEEGARRAVGQREAPPES